MQEVQRSSLWIIFPIHFLQLRKRHPFWPRMHLFIVRPEPKPWWEHDPGLLAVRCGHLLCHKDIFVALLWQILLWRPYPTIKGVADWAEARTLRGWRDVRGFPSWTQQLSLQPDLVHVRPWKIWDSGRVSLAWTTTMHVSYHTSFTGELANIVPENHDNLVFTS